MLRPRGLEASNLLALLFGVTNISAQTTPDLGTLLAGNSNLTTFYSLIQTYPGLLLELPSYNGVTILAPNDDAFDKIPYSSLNDAFANNDTDVIKNVLQYHILQGTWPAAQLTPGTPAFIPTLMTNTSYTNVTGGQHVQNIAGQDVVTFVSGMGSRSTAVQTDLQFTGGYVQVIDSLLIPPTNLTTTAYAFNLTSFEGALYNTSSIQNTSTFQNITVFAPNNDAFQLLGPAITNLSVSQLSGIMNYHIVQNASGPLYSTFLTNGTILNTLEGGNLTITKAGNTLYINSAQVEAEDILLANGVLHVLGDVLNWQAPYAQPNPAAAFQGPVFGGASMAQDAPYTSDLPCTVSCPVTTSAGASATDGGSGSAATTTESVFHATETSKGVGARMTAGMLMPVFVGAGLMF